MRNKILKLEQESRKLDPTDSERMKMTEQAIHFGLKFTEDIPNQKAFITSKDKGAGILEYPIREEPGSMEHLLELFQDEVVLPGLNPASGAHLGYIPGGGVYPSALADYLADVTNRYSGVFFSNPGTVRLENMMIRWMGSIVGFPIEKIAGNLTSGGSIANLIALVTARDHFGLKAKDFERSVIYTTGQVHHCINKAIHIAGMSDTIVRKIPMDEQFRMKTDSLEYHIASDLDDGLNPFLIIASCGTTDVGAVDPLLEIGEIAEKYNLWYHVDAAYGGFFLLSQEGKKMIKGIEKADSVIMDPHKGLFLPYGSGAVIIKDGDRLYRSQHYTAPYMQDTFSSTEELSPADLSPELSRHFRGLRMWLPLQLFGLAPFRAALEEKIWLSRYFYEKVQNIEGVETGPQPQLSVMFFRFVPSVGDANDFNKRLISKIQEDGRIFMSSTNIQGNFYIRMAVVGFRTHLREIDLALDIIRNKISEIKEE